MVGRCFIKNCPTGSRFESEKVSVFHPPKGELLKWQELIPRKDKTLTHNHFICEKHFQKKLIIRELKSNAFSIPLQKPRLAKGAIPTIFGTSIEDKGVYNPSAEASTTTTIAFTQTQNAEPEENILEIISLETVVMMPSLANCVTKPSNIATMPNSLDIFSSYNNHRDDRDSDEESFHLPLDDDEDRFEDDDEDNVNDFETTVIERHIDDQDQESEDQLPSNNEDEKQKEIHQADEEIPKRSQKATEDEATLMEVDEPIPNTLDNSADGNNTSMDHLVCEDDGDETTELETTKIPKTAEDEDNIENDVNDLQEQEVEMKETTTQSFSSLTDNVFDEIESLAQEQSSNGQLEPNENKIKTREQMEVEESEEESLLKMLQDDNLEIDYKKTNDKPAVHILDDDDKEEIREHTNEEINSQKNLEDDNDEEKILEDDDDDNIKLSEIAKEKKNLDDDTEEKMLEDDDEEKILKDDDEERLIEEDEEKIIEDAENQNESSGEVRNSKKRGEESIVIDKLDDGNNEQTKILSKASKKTDLMEKSITKEPLEKEKTVTDSSPTEESDVELLSNDKELEEFSDKVTENIDDKKEVRVIDDKIEPNKTLPLKTCDKISSNKRTNRQESSDSTNEENVPEEEKNDNDDADDLFDISVIKDAQQDHDDNVKAYNENQLEQNDEDERTVDKGEDDSNDKTNELEEDEDMDSERTDRAKHDDDDFDEFTCDGSKDTSDVENDKTIVPDAQLVNGESSRHSNTDSGLESSDSDKVVESMETSDDSAKDTLETKADEEKVEEKVKSEIDDRRASLKRSFDGEDEEASVAKKSRTDAKEAIQNEVENTTPEKCQKKADKPLATLLSLASFMQDKKQSRRMTIHDLEQFALLKVCEALVDNSELGDARHHIKMQEQLLESMRKEMQQLSKQVRDLEIVNKKLMNDVKQHQQGLTQKPLNPLRITRSVGLQVKFTSTIENTVRRKAQNVVLTTGGKFHTLGCILNTSRNRNIPNTTSPGVTTKNVQASPQKQVQQTITTTTPTAAAATTTTTTPKLTGPLLSQALQNRSRTSSTESPTKAATPTTSRTPPQRPATASVIDLTDEDDKNNKNTASKVNTPKANAIVRAPARINNGTVRLTPQGKVTLTNPPGKVTLTNQSGKLAIANQQGKVTLSAQQTKGGTAVATSTSPQLMYVVQSSASTNATLTGAKAVVVNFQTNGVLSSALNGSAVSMIPKQNAVQLKTAPPQQKAIVPNNKSLKPATKHPAPLPPPPIIRVSYDKPLKPIPPKPHLTIRKTDTGIILQWKMPYELDMYELIASYQLYAYQETSAQPSTDMWRKVGDVKALALPMACTLTQFADKNKYYFAVRPVDIHKRIGVFSEPEEISL